jgi:hypothetical protein
MIEDRFDARTLANMQVALERVCRQRPNGQYHKFRRRVAQRIMQCARGVKELWAHLQKPVNVPSGSAHYRFCPTLKIPEIASTL